MGLVFFENSRCLAVVDVPLAQQAPLPIPETLPSMRYELRVFSAGLAALLALPFTSSLHAAAAKGGADVLGGLKQKALQEAVGTLLDHQLPLKLDASTLYPSVGKLPGAGAFNPVRFKVTAENWDQPLPPGDYVVRAVAFCSEYSVHRSGAGTAYEVGPIQGKAAEAISALLWRGTVVKHRFPRELQMVSFAIQSGLTYAKMPQRYQAIIDDVIPEFRGRLASDFVDNLQDLYTARAKELGLPPLNTMLAQLGKPGELVISANRQRVALLRQNLTDERRDQILYAGQEQRIAPIRASEGPWTEKIPGVAYVRYRVVGGNMKANNEIQLRVLPAAPAKVGLVMPAPRGVFGALAPERTHLVAAAASPKPKGPSLYEIVHDGIGYAVGRGAQVLYFAPVTVPDDGSPPVGKVLEVDGDAKLKRHGQTGPLGNKDEIKMHDTLTTGDGKLFIEFADGTTLQIAPNTTFTIDRAVYNPADGDEGGSSFEWLQGAFVYASGLAHKDKPRDIHAPVGEIGIRGTEFVARYVAETDTVDIKLISGSLLLSPLAISTSTLVTAPVTVTFTKDSVTTVPLTRQDYDGHKRPMLIR